MHLALVAAAAFALSACASPDTTAQNAPPGTTASAPAPSVQPLAASDMAATMADSNVVVIDVRTPSEFAAGHVQGALNYDVTAPAFAQQIATLDKGKTYVLYCRSGARSGRAGEQMLAAGFTRLFNAGGFAALQAAGLPTQ